MVTQSNESDRRATAEKMATIYISAALNLLPARVWTFINRQVFGDYAPSYVPKPVSCSLWTSGLSKHRQAARDSPARSERLAPGINQIII